jgi:hypothetical protein
LAHGHVNLVHIRTLFAVHLDGNVMSVQKPGDFLVFERLVRHHMAPVARGISYGKEDRFLFLFRPCKGILTPRIPVHGISGMLEKVGAFFVNQTI